MRVTVRERERGGRERSSERERAWVDGDVGVKEHANADRGPCSLQRKQGGGVGSGG